MSYSPTLGSVFNRTKMRDPSHVCSFSGMCAMCTADCIGSCEIGLSAVRGMETVYPTTTGENQIASEKVYPVDYSHFNINGRSFGAMGAPLDAIAPPSTCGARTGDRHPQPREAGAADHPARAHQAQLARLLRRRGHGGRNAVIGEGP